MISPVLALLGDLTPDEVVTWGELVARSSQYAARVAVVEGLVVRLGRGRYRLATPDHASDRRDWSTWDDEPTEAECLEIAADLADAHAHKGALCLLSAARALGWMTLEPPTRTTIVVPRKVQVSPNRSGIRLYRRDLPEGFVVDRCTTPLVTAVQCAAALPFQEALAVADSALRSELVGAHELVEAADVFRGRGALQARRVAALADRRAANPFESALRAVVADVPGFEAEPQVAIPTRSDTMQVDLADVARGIVIEGDSYRFHGGTEEFAADIERYNLLTAEGWTVLRATWSQVRDRPDELRRIVSDTMANHQARVA